MLLLITWCKQGSGWLQGGLLLLKSFSNNKKKTFQEPAYCLIHLQHPHTGCAFLKMWRMIFLKMCRFIVQYNHTFLLQFINVFWGKYKSSKTILQTLCLVLGCSDSQEGSNSLPHFFFLPFWLIISPKINCCLTYKTGFMKMQIALWLWIILTQ